MAELTEEDGSRVKERYAVNTFPKIKLPIAQVA